MPAMDRRTFLAAGAAGIAASAVSPAASTPPARPNEPFQLLYAPHFGMFSNHAKALEDQLQFAADEGFRAWEDNGMRGRETTLQDKLAAKMQQTGITMGVFIAHGDFGKPTFASGQNEHRERVLYDMERACEVAKRVNARWCTVVPGTVDPRQDMGYEEARRIDVLKVQRAAQTSLEWFENSERYLGQDPERFVFNLMTRSKRITYENLRLRDPELVARVDAVTAREEGATDVAADTPPAFLPFTVRGCTLPNRVVVSPMCQYSATDGLPNDWHLVHLGGRAIGGAGLLFTEMTNVSADARISLGCAGMWNDDQMRAWRRIVDFVHAHSGARIGMQLAHAGRKASCSRPWEGDRPLVSGGWPTIGPSNEPFEPDWPAPRAMGRDDMDAVRDAFVHSAKLCEQAGFDVIELHMAHGYLLSSFLSPLSNLRTDDYGGSLENRARYPIEVLEAVRQAWPDDKPLFVRISASDWFDVEQRGFTVDEAVRLSRWLHESGCDVVDVSSAGNSPESRPQYGRMYQVPFAERIRKEAGVPVMAVGGIQGVDHVNTIVAAGRADLCAIARAHLSDPYLTLRGANDREIRSQQWPPQYLAARR